MKISITVETTSRLTDAEKELVNLKQKCSDAELIKSNVSLYDIMFLEDLL